MPPNSTVAEATGINFGWASAVASDARASSATVALWILAVLASLWFIRAARALLIPIALGVLISYALEPIVGWLERRRIPRTLGAGAVMLFLLALAGVGVYVLRDDVMQVVETMPGKLEQARESVLTELGASPEMARRAGDALKSNGAAPITIGSLSSMALNVVVVFFLIFFLLISRDQIKDRVLEVAGPTAERRRTAAAIINDINSQIQRYLLVLLATAVMVGAATWAVLAWQGVEHAPMWGMLAGVFNSIPYFGPMIVSGGLFFVGLAQGGGVTQALQLSGAALLITSLEGWLVTPALMGKAERMSALVVFVGLVVWIWVWGEWGTILAVPMLAAFKAVADRVDALKPVGRLMAR
jgi:predicted PurR-regulated permease PerM